MKHTYTRTYNTTTYADPYKKCLKCGDWITGALEAPDPLTLVPPATTRATTATSAHRGDRSTDASAPNTSARSITQFRPRLLSGIERHE